VEFAAGRSLVDEVGRCDIGSGEENIVNAVLRAQGEDLLAQRHVHVQEFLLQLSMLGGEDRCAAGVSADNPLDRDVEQQEKAE
jgi:hypothetical protein